jgi:hypothetical protein
MSNFKEVIYRETYDILEWFGDIGGLSGILFSIGAFLCSRFSELKLTTILANSFYKWHAPESCKDISNIVKYDKKVSVQAKGKKLKYWPQDYLINDLESNQSV